jgi:starch-binding outer membrane protein, SusD/RagB family
MMPTFTRALAVGTLVLAVACDSERLVVPNYQNPTPDDIERDPVAAIPLLATGVLRTDRDNHLGFIGGVGILGREAYNYTVTEGRNTTGWLTADVNNQASFGGVSNWAGYYTTLRNIKNLITLAENTPDATISAQRKSAALGFAHTMEALALSYVISLRHNLGVPVEMKDNPVELAPFVSRDSAYNYILARLELAKTELVAGGTAFPFTLHAGFAGFTTPTNFLRVNRAIAARINVYRASLGVAGCGAARSAACYNTALTNLTESFLNPTGSLTTGAFRVYSATANDVANTVSNANTINWVAHVNSDVGVQNRGDGTKDLRFQGKIFALATPKAAASATIGVTTPWDFSIYPARETPISIIRNEELILLRAEARYYTGDVPGALADINTIRVSSGGLDPIAAFASESAFLDELLYNRRWSLLFEGHRWIDVRRFGRLNTLPLDLPNHITVQQLPVPQAECLQRANVATELRAPGCI